MACLATSPVSQRVHTSLLSATTAHQCQSKTALDPPYEWVFQDLTWCESVGVSLAYYHLVLPHTRLREPCRP